MDTEHVNLPATAPELSWRQDNAEASEHLEAPERADTTLRALVERWWSPTSPAATAVDVKWVPDLIQQYGTASRVIEREGAISIELDSSLPDARAERALLHCLTELRLTEISSQCEQVITRRVKDPLRRETELHKHHQFRAIRRRSLQLAYGPKETGG